MTRFLFVLIICLFASQSQAQSNHFIAINYGALSGISATYDNGARLNSAVEVYANLDIRKTKNTKLLVGYNYVRENKDFQEDIGNLFAPEFKDVHGSSNIHIPFIGLSRFKEYDNKMQMGFGVKLGMPFYTDQLYVSGGQDISHEYNNIAHWTGIYTEYAFFGQFPTKIESFAINVQPIVGFVGKGFTAYSSLGYLGLRLGCVYNL